MQHRSVTPLKYLEHLKWFNFLRSLFSQEVMSYHDRALHLKYSEKNSVHGVESVQIRVFFWSVFSCIRTEYRKSESSENKSLKRT